MRLGIVVGVVVLVMVAEVAAAQPASGPTPSAVATCNACDVAEMVAACGSLPKPLGPEAWSFLRAAVLFGIIAWATVRIADIGRQMHAEWMRSKREHLDKQTAEELLKRLVALNSIFNVRYK